VISNSNATTGVTASVQQTRVSSTNTNVSTLTISLAASKTQTLGCAAQDPPPATNVHFSWQVQSA
jgi:hypothetical protein